MHLFIVAQPDMVKLYMDAAEEYNSTPYEARNSGFDLYCDKEEPFSNHSILVSQGCTAVAIDAGRNRAFWLVPRSSISKTPWRLANSMGLIDATYRGTIKAAFTKTDTSPTRGQRLVQLAQPDLLPWDHVSVVDVLPGPNTERGKGGFGSTGS